ncbi:MAG: TonB-dependent receptor [Acidobacteriota bacterium]|nr:TonB-dependent receptor [Acidobacteriota bacterium]
MSSIRILLASICAVLVASTVQAGTVSGKTTFSGEAPEGRIIKMNADPKCVEINGGKEVRSADTVVGDDGGLANVFVYLKNPPEGDYPVPEEPVVLSQEGCLYTPRIQGIVLEQTLQIANDDDTLHNVRALAVHNRPFNLGQPPATPPRTKTFKVAEPALKFKCDVHPWMSSTIFVLNHPFYAVSGADGSFTIDKVADGTYTVIAWHESLGEQESEVKVSGGTLVDFEFVAAE